MIPYDTDPSLHTGEPEPPVLDDGFSPRPHHEDPEAAPDQPALPAATLLPEKSAF
jgi:hypothetical protein